MDHWPEGEHFGNCYISLIPSGYTNSYIAQQELSDSIDNVHISTKIANTFTIQNGMLNSGDGVHYTQKGDNVIAGYLAASVIPNVSDTHSIMTSIDWEVGSSWTLMKTLPIILLVGLVLSMAAIVVHNRD